MKGMAKLLFMVLGITSLGIGAVGVFVPLLPTTPFLLLAAFLLLRSSDRVRDWFLNTEIYKNKVKPLKETKAMTKHSKIKVIGMLTILLIFCFYLARNILIAKIIIILIWLFHIIYFFFILKTMPE